MTLLPRPARWIRPIRPIRHPRLLALQSLATLLAAPLLVACAATPPGTARGHLKATPEVQLGPRPFFLVEDLEDSPLKRELQRCAARGGFEKRDWSIGHRGAALQFPEHTRESYMAAARMGAGIVECDVTFTKDRQLVCRHAQNDLATTTNILVTPLAATCVQPFVPATLDAEGKLLMPAKAECRTSELTLAEFKTLRGKMDAYNPAARTPAEYLGGTPGFRTDLYAGPSSGTLMTHAESIALLRQLGVKMTPELKSPSVSMPFHGYTQQAYAQQLIDEYKAAGVPADQVYPQSFSLRDLQYWIAHEPEFARQAVYLDNAQTVAELPGAARLVEYRQQGVRIVAPPLFALLALNPAGEIVPSDYARNAKAAGLEIIGWSLERSGVLADGRNGFYYQTIDAAIRRDGDVLRVLDVLNRQIGLRGLFSDWPATTTFYANCAGLD